MARAIERIEKDIETLEAGIRAIAQELHASYTRYFSVMGVAVRQQLILATYHLCTQGYPEAFLQLSLKQRQELQQSIRQVGSNAVTKLMEYTKTDKEVSDNSGEGSEADTDSKALENSILESLSAAIVEAIGSQHQSFSSDDDHNPIHRDRSDLPTLEIANISDFNGIEIEDDDYDDDDDDDDEIISQSEQENHSLKNLRRKFRQTRKIIIPGHLLRVLPFPSESSNPIELLKWQQSIEFGTQQTIKKTSHEANLILQKSQILPQNIPEPVLNVANSASDGSTEVIPGPPNLLNLVIDIGTNQLTEESQLTPIMLINLRLGEIEFADVKVAHERRNLRNTTMQLQKLKRDYQKKLRERSTAEAEAAWRASWYDEM